jgi:hypothetical protein
MFLFEFVAALMVVGLSSTAGLFGHAPLPLAFRDVIIQVHRRRLLIVIS